MHPKIFNLVENFQAVFNSNEEYINLSWLKVIQLIFLRNLFFKKVRINQLEILVVN